MIYLPDSMSEHRTPWDVVTKCVMSESGRIPPLKAWIFLEGYTDANALKFFNNNDIGVMVAGCREKAKTAFEIYRSHNGLPALCILDADYSHHAFFKIATDKNIFLTDLNDLTSMLFMSKALLNLLSTWHLYSNEAEEYRKSAIDRSYILGLFRFVSSREKLKLNFSNKPNTILDKFPYDLKKIAQVLLAETKGQLFIAKDELIEMVQIELDKNHSSKISFCQGHDLCIALSIILQNNIRKGLDHTKSSAIERSMGLAYEFSCFSKSQLFSSLFSWSVFHNIPLFNSEYIRWIAQNSDLSSIEKILI